MKKNDFENRLQNDLFPEMPASFGRKLTEALGSEGVQVKKRPTAKGILAGALGVVAAAACLVMVLVSVLGGGKSKLNAAAPGDATATSQTVQPTPEQTNLVKEKLGVPDAYQFSTTEADGRLKIIVDAQVRVPDVERLPMVQVRKSRFSQERINQVAQILFAGDPMYDYDQDGEPLFDGQLRPFQDVYGVHPEVLHLDIRNKPASEWEQSENRKRMIAWVSVTEEELRACDGEHISFTTWPDREEASERYDETVPVDLNAPAFQAAKAHTDAFFQTLGLGDAYCFAYGSQVRDGSGYHLYYTASIQGVEAYVSKNDRSDGEEGHTILWGQESILFVADEDGIQSLSWMHPVEMLETASEAPTLLPFSDIQARFETEVRNKYAILLNRYAWSKGTMEVSVDDIRLCLMRLPIQDGNELESTMIPVWAFYGHNQVERTDGTIRYDLQTSLGNDAPIDSISILVLNAMDGSIITLW